MSANYIYAENATLQTAAREKLPALTMDDPLFNHVAPINQEDTDTVVWEQDDNLRGLMDARTLNGRFPAIERAGAKQYLMKPGYWGNQIFVDERRLTTAREFGTWGQRINVEKLQMKDQDQLLARAIDRLRYIISTFALTGVYYQFDNGQLIPVQKFNVQSFTSSVPVNTVATATPLADLRALALLSRGQSASFGEGAVLLMNQKTVNAILSNTNAGDIGKFFVLNGAPTSTPLSLSDLNRIGIAQGLPTIVVYEEGYFDDTGTWTLFIPDGKAILVGKRPDGERPMDFVMTANANHLRPKSPEFTPERVSDLYYSWKWEEDPILGISTMGFNGGLRPMHPGAMVAWNLW